jgi:hypothetical protein
MDVLSFGGHRLNYRLRRLARIVGGRVKVFPVFGIMARQEEAFEGVGYVVLNFG